MMFLRVKKSVLKSTGKLPNPNLETPVVKRIQMLGQLHDLAESIVKDVKSINKLFDQDDGPLKNSLECFAVSLKLLGISVKQSHPEYMTFLEKQSDLYNELGHLQRKLQYDLNVRVITPLIGWLQADYVRMNNEITKLYDRKSEYDIVTQEVAKDPKDEHLILHQDLCKREFERQLEIAKYELLRLSGVKNNFARILNQFTASFKEFTSNSRKLLEKIQPDIQI